MGGFNLPQGMSLADAVKQFRPFAQGGEFEEEAPLAEQMKAFSAPMNAGDTPTPTNHIDDDPQSRHNPDLTGGSDEFADNAAGMAQASRASLADQVRQSQTAQPSRLSQLQREYDATQAPPAKPSLLKKIGLIAGGAIGGPRFAQSLQQQNQFAANQQREKGNSILQQIEAERQMQQRQNDLDQSEDFAREQSDATRNFQASQAQPEHIDTDQGPLAYNRRTGQFEPIMVNGKPVGPKAQPKPDTPEQQFFDSPEEQGKTLTQKAQDWAKASQRPEQPQRPPQQLAIGPDGTVLDLKPGTVVPQGTRTVSGDLNNKPTADEQRRSDLAENLNENLSTLEEIVTRRPDLFGPIAGRWTGLKGALGSNDPDIGTLETIKHQLGMAQISAHGMRSAQGIDGAANSILNSFKNGPDAVKASIAAARNSVKTFTADASRNSNRGAGGGSSNTNSLKQNQQLSLEEARGYLQRAGGDKNKARQLAKQDGRTF